jgi:hypothetical protein
MANIYVNHAGSNTSPYDTEAKASTSVQTALDAAQSGDTVWIKADQNYVMNGTDQQAAQFDVDADNNITIRGYYQNIGDQDYGGAYYKDSNYGWAVIDANSGSFHIFSAGDKGGLCWHNLKIINVGTGKIPFDLTPTTEQMGYMVKNCWTTGGKRGIDCTNLGNPIIQDCAFTGTYAEAGTLGVVFLPASCERGMIMRNCNFSCSLSGTARAVSCLNYGMNVIEHNVFSITGTVNTIVVIGGACILANNVIYEGTGGDIAVGVTLTSLAKSSMVINNIIVGCTTSISDAATIVFGGWNCFYNNGTNWTLRDGDIVADPQFMDAPNGDFRLKSTSPCLNAGMPTLSSGYTDIGTWQRKSLLRYK